MNKSELLFVYNAKSNLLNKTFDFMHKIISPQTYNCKLCSLTYNSFAEQKEWANFRKTLHIEFKFFYSNIFENEFPLEKTDYPVVYLKSNIELKKVITTNELNSIENLKELIQLVTEKLKV